MSKSNFDHNLVSVAKNNDFNQDSIDNSLI